MIDEADHVVCTAEVIHTRLSLAYPDKPLTLIPNGADSSFFHIPFSERPTDLPPGPVVAYIGAWAYWVDHELFAKAALRFPNVQFVSIGAPYGSPAIIRSSPMCIYLVKSHTRSSSVI